MNRESNSYTFLFIGVMIVGIASILAYTSQTLKPLQKENIRKEKMQNILSTVGVNVSPEEAEELYNQYVIEELSLRNDGTELMVMAVALAEDTIPSTPPAASANERVPVPLVTST